MDNLIIWKTVLWSAPVVGVIIGGIISLFANFKINNIEKEIKKQETQQTQEYRGKTLANQDSILEANQFTNEKTNSISVQIEENNALIIKQQEIDKEEFEKTNRPVLHIIQDQILLKGKNNNYNITVKNFGKSTANIVDLTINYLTPKGITFVRRVKELPPDEQIVFHVPMVPDFAILPLNRGWENERQKFIDEFIRGEKIISFNIQLNYKWEDIKYNSREYTIIHEQPTKVTMW